MRLAEAKTFRGEGGVGDGYKRETRHKTQDARHKTQDTRHKTQETRDKTQDTRHKTQDTRHKTQDTRNKKQETRNKKQGTRHTGTNIVTQHHIILILAQEFRILKIKIKMTSRHFFPEITITFLKKCMGTSRSYLVNMCT